MATDIVNVTESKLLQDRVTFEVDTEGVTPEAVQDLAECMRQLIQSEEVEHLFDRNFSPYAAMVEVGNPLKYKVPPPHMLRGQGHHRHRHNNSSCISA
jgi:hypothetical protein